MILRKHQRNVFYWSKNIDHPGFFLKMRLGKTRLTIMDVKRFKCFPCLVFCPYSAIYGWKEDLQLCGFNENEYMVIKGTKLQRVQSIVYAIEMRYKFILTNRESHLSIGEELSVQPWHSIVLDESTCIKNEGTAITRYFTNNFRNVDRRYILTGTPIPDNLLDIYNQVKFLNENIFYETPSYYSFKSKYFVKTMFGWDAPNKHKNFIVRRLSEHCYTMEHKEAGIGNKKIYERKVFQLKKKTMKTYIDFVKNFILEYEETIYKVTDFSIATIAPLRLLCSGFIKNEKTLGFDFVDSSKIELLIELLSTELKGNHIIIWCDFIIEVQIIYELIRKRNISCQCIYGATSKDNRNKYIESFQKGKSKVLIAHPKCFKYGTKLDKADTTIYFSSPLGGETREQTEARMNNPFKNEPDLIVDLIAEDTLEEKNLISLKRKDSRQQVIKRLIKHFQKIYNEK